MERGGGEPYQPSKVPQALNNATTYVRDAVMVSGRYVINQNGPLPPQPILIEHCCLIAQGTTWTISIKCRPHSTQKNENWRNIMEVYPDAKVDLKLKEIQLTSPVLRENLEVAAFGVPGKDDHRRMQLRIFGMEPIKGSDWNIRVYLIDDSEMAIKQVCKEGESSGSKLLTALPGLYVSNSEEDISINLTDLKPGWQIRGEKVKTIASRDAWYSQENATGFSCCVFVVSHVDPTEQQFFCRIRAKHRNVSVSKEVVASFQQRDTKIKNPPEKKLNNTPQINCSKVSSMSTGMTHSGCSKERYELMLLSDGRSIVTLIHQLHKGGRSENAMYKKIVEGQRKRFNLRPVGSWEFCWQGQFIIVTIESKEGGFRDTKSLKRSKVNEMNLTGVRTTFAPPVPFSSPLRVSVSVENEEAVMLLYTGMQTVESPLPPNTKRGGRIPVEHTDTSVGYHLTHQQMVVPGIDYCMFLILFYYCYLNWRRVNSS